MVSALTGIPVRADVAMTGEITLRGEVLPIGGLKEKLLAAHRGGIKTVLIPEENVKDLAEIPDNVKNRLEIHPVKWIDSVLDMALERKTEPLPEEQDVAAPLPPGTEATGARRGQALATCVTGDPVTVTGREKGGSLPPFFFSARHDRTFSRLRHARATRREKTKRAAESLNSFEIPSATFARDCEFAQRVDASARHRPRVFS